MTEILDIGVPSGRTLTAGVGLAGGGTLAADRTFTVAIPQINGFRLTLTTALPVTTADVTGATTIYLTPYKGGMIALYDGAAWALYSSAEISVALGTLTSGLPYDVFVLQTAGVLSMELLAWTNGTTRATALALTNGVWLKTGALTRRYVGTFYTTSTTATADAAGGVGTAPQRYLFNADNRCLRPMFVGESTNSWVYNTDTYRAANNSTTNRLQFLIGLSEDPVRAQVIVGVDQTTAAADSAIGIGLDSTSVDSAQVKSFSIVLLAGRFGHFFASYEGFPGVGVHYLQWLERSDTATTTWEGDGGHPEWWQSGIWGAVWA